MVAANQPAEIERRSLEAGAVAYQQFHGTIASIESVTSSVRSWVVTMGYKPEGPTAVEINGEPNADDATAQYDIEVQLPVGPNAKAHPSDHVQIKPFAATDAIVMTLRGPSELTSIGGPLEQMKSWMQERNVAPGPVVRWVEVTDPAKVSPDEQITEVQYLIAAS